MIDVVRVIEKCFMAQEIEDEITNYLSRTTVSNGDNLLGFEIDLEMALINDRDLFADPSTRRTGDPRCLLIGTCELTDPAIPADMLVNRLKEMWVKHLAYRHAESHRIEVSPEQISLRFVTTTGNTSSDICVTGKIIVYGLRS